MEAETGTVTYQYQLLFADGESRAFTVELESETLTIVPSPHRVLPKWTRLGFNQCSGCPLDETTHEYCPVAANAGLCERIRAIGTEDACLNAITILGAQSELTRFAVRGPEMDRLHQLFSLGFADDDEAPAK